MLSINAVLSHPHQSHTLFRYLLSTEYIVERMRVWGGGGRWKGFYRNEAGSTITFLHINEGSEESASMIWDARVEFLTIVLTDGLFHHKRDMLDYGLRQLFHWWAILQPAYGESAVTDTESVFASLKAKDEIKGTRSTWTGCVQNHNALWRYPEPRHESRCVWKSTWHHVWGQMCRFIKAFSSSL